MSGFPCQPLSQQGDMQGPADVRTQVFYAVTKAAWEQQVAGVLLECVPGAMHAPHIQSELQKLGHSLGMDIVQRVLPLHFSWPCRRTRWWCTLLPRTFQIYDIGSMPVFEKFQKVQSIFGKWPIWPDEVESLLELSNDELRIYLDPAFGTDQRRLQMNGTASCILHSYGSVLQECPCACRGKFSMHRLQRDGVRGYFVQGKNNKERYLHVAEAAYLCSLRPSMVFPSGPRSALCQVGLCAAPLQALWVLGRTMEVMNINPYLTAFNAMEFYQMMLLREAHGVFQTSLDPSMLRLWSLHDPPVEITANSGQTVQDLIDAEKKLHEHGLQIYVHDAMGQLKGTTLLSSKPFAGVYAMASRPKNKRKQYTLDSIRISILLIVEDQMKVVEGLYPAGTFLFEAVYDLGLPRLHHRLHDDRGRLWHLDDRVWEPIHLTQWQQVTANGIPSSTPAIGGLSDMNLDMMAQLLIKQGCNDHSIFWMPSATATWWFHNPEIAYFLDHWILAALHGRLFLALALQRHWILLECRVTQGLLQVIYMDGQDHVHDENIFKFTLKMARLLGLTTVCLTRTQIFSQTSCQTCGTVALLHLGWALGLWNESSHPDELRWHWHIRQLGPFDGHIFANGKGTNADDREVIWALRDVLKDHGVPEDRTEERATLALEKIGTTKLKEALHSRHPWPALKALGSAPRINFLFVKPDELEQQIRRRAQTKFRVQPADKKLKSGKAKVEGCDIDPQQLQLIEDTFVLQNEDRSVKQLSMQDVGTHRAGLAFGRTSEVMPFLREGKSLSLDGLAVLTTSRIPPMEQGLLPVINLRYPAIYLPTMEPILLEGSLVNLGDMTFVRKQEQDVIHTEAIDTCVLKINVYKDEWVGDWAYFIKSPLKLVFQKHPLFTLCSGQKCGGQCPRYHPPVDTEIDSVVMDLWARSWLTIRGKKAQAEDADIFQVLVRVPETLLLPLQKLSGQGGVYIEPRQSEGKRH